MSETFSQLTAGWHVYGNNTNIQNGFDVAVVMPTVGRDSVIAAVNSVFAQDNVGRIQLLIGVDVMLGDLARLQELLSVAPDHVTPCLFCPGYSTSVRHGGVHPAHDGGALRTILSYLANARYVAYLDDDNWWAPSHLSSMLKAIVNKEWAFALRWFVHPESLQPVSVDDWESTGPGRGNFVKRFGGWVDPNCLMIDKLACEPVLRLWSNPLPGDKSLLLSDRHVYDWLQRKSKPGETDLATVYYVMQTKDGNHPYRVQRMGLSYISAGAIAKKDVPRLTAITTCKNRLHHLKQTLPLLARQPSTDVVVVDYGCGQGTASWVREHYPNVKVINVLDDSGFNVARARNIGAKAATTPWLLFIDADIVVSDDLADWLSHGLQPDNFYITSNFGATDVSGTCFCAKLAFDSVGGYDEAFSGWGGEDDDFYLQLSRAGQHLLNYPAALFSAIPHSDEERFSFSKGSNRSKQLILNHWYRCMKYDLMATREGALSIEERMSLRALALELQQRATTNNQFSSTEVILGLGERMEMLRSTTWKIERQLVYKFSSRSA
ncbi:MAG: glycosyltransferase [Pseudomonadota bacterium]